MAILVSLLRLPPLPELCSWPVGGAPASVSSRSAMDALAPRSSNESELWTGNVSDSSEDSSWIAISSSTAYAGEACGAGSAGVGGGGAGGCG
uniref:Uncharacterized protein n=1 Tax=Arundo donax TaxID=35708 RepID=A0A0A9BSY2_ARUDO